MFNILRRIDCIIGKIIFGLFRLFGIQSPANKPIPQQVKKILCIKLWGLGNLILIYPLLQRIKEIFPQAEISCLTFDSNRGFLEQNPAVDRVCYFPLTKNPFRIAWQFLKLLRKFHRERPQLLINFETFNHASGLLAYLTAADIRIGLYRKYEQVFYHYPVFHETTTHITELFLNLLRPLGCQEPYRYFNFPKCLPRENKVESLLKQVGVNRFICIHPATSDNIRGKRYDPGKFSILAALFRREFNLPIIFTGSAREGGIIQQILRKVAGNGGMFDFSGKLTIWELVELLRKADLFVCGDTGPMHIAASLNINLATFYGPSSPAKYQPRNANSLLFYRQLPCSPCVGADYINHPCPNKFSCLDFSPEEIMAKIAAKFPHVKGCAVPATARDSRAQRHP